MIERVDHLEIWARDLDETVAFYTNVLGFERSRRTLARRPDGTEQEIACVVLGDFMIEFLKASALAAQAEVAHDALGAKTFALRVDDMEATSAALKARGVVFSREPRPGTSFDGLRAEILDPNGLSIELREWRGGDGYRDTTWRPASDAVTLLS